jgi:Fe-S-cluster-containing dehydrogenase component/formate-dependent nitrite reductase membrane component NrfD
VRYGFVIDQRACIGCHACTVACKEEHEVPLGVFRTWVKYVERGTYPETRRFFSVLRCNHCDNAPCVTICPTVALYRRPDGIVDFDSTRCIGCKSCLQACPYDALYIDPSTHTAAKCNYCAHRVEVGLEPACVIVCPERAIIAGDLDDPGSLIAQHVARDPVQVRKPELGTEPKVFYLGADAAALAPSLQAPADAYMWSERTAGDTTLATMLNEARRHGGGNGNGARVDAPGLARPVYDVPHMAYPWGWRVAAYLWTKSIAAGVMMVAALARGAGEFSFSRNWLDGVGPPLVALLFLAITTALLVLDLKRPDRFLYILLKSNPRSWLVRGTWVLVGYAGLAVLWLLAASRQQFAVLDWLAAPVFLFAAGAAGYSAFLFNQAEGRAFWRSPLLLPHLLVSALLAGLSSSWLIVMMRGNERYIVGPVIAPLVPIAFLGTGLLLLAEFAGTHANRDGALAARLVTRGPWRGAFWGGVVLAGLVAPLLLYFSGPVLRSDALLALAPILALAGLFIYEWIWVKAGQAVPLS